MNVAEYMLEAIGTGVTARIGPKDRGDLWVESREFYATKEEIVRLRKDGLRTNSTEQAEQASTRESFLPLRRTPSFVDQHDPSSLSHPTNHHYDGPLADAAPFWIRVVTVPDYIFIRLFVHVFIALFTSLTLLQLGKSVRDLQYRTAHWFLL